MVRIRRSHRRGRGSIPRMGIVSFFVCFPIHFFQFFLIFQIPSRKIEIKAPLELPSVTDSSINVENIFTIAATPTSAQSTIVIPAQTIIGEAAFMETQSALSTSTMDLTSDQAISTVSMATDLDTVLTEDTRTEEQFITIIELQSNHATAEGRLERDTK